MDVTNDAFGIVIENVIADGVDQVRLAETGTPINEKRVVGRLARVDRNLSRSGARQIVGFADDQVLKGERS
jgi:hypothetical protein